MKDRESSCLGDSHLASIEGAREENILLLQNYYKTDEMFLEVFEDEYLEMSAAKTLSIEHLMMDSNLLLPPAGSPLTGISFDKRLPCGEVRQFHL
jgi:protein CLEC16A